MSKRADSPTETEETLAVTGKFLGPVRQDADGPYREIEEKTVIMPALAESTGSPVVLPPPSTPIHDAVLALRDAGRLSVADCRGVAELPGVRTLGDLVTVLGRGEIEGKLAAKLRKVLG